MRIIAVMSLLTMLTLMMFAGCGPTPNKPETIESKVVPTFDFVPPSKTPTDSASIVFCLVAPSYPDAWKEYLAYYPYDKFVKNMPLDFEEIISAKGFRMRGPFRTYDEMTFPDKKEGDLILTPKIEIDITPVGKVEQGKEFLTDVPFWKWKGQVNLSGRITISLNETLTNERMWTKSVELPAKSFTYKSPASQQPITGPQPSDTEFGNLLAVQLQDYYTTTMDQVWKYLDPQEMAMVKKQARDLKEKKVY
jgi:hypothetical protein